MAGEEGFFGVLGRIASTFASGSPDGPRHVWTALYPWVQDLTTNASARWLKHLVVHIPCDVTWPAPPKRPVRCESSAVAACELCKKPCCLKHAFVSGGGEVCCYACVAQAAADRQPKIPPSWQERQGQTPPRPAEAPPPPAAHETPLDERFAAARKTLGVKRSATWPEVQQAYRELLKKHHPDRNPGHHVRAEQRFKQVRVAYDLLQQAYPEAQRKHP